MAASCCDLPRQSPGRLAIPTPRPATLLSTEAELIASVWGNRLALSLCEQRERDDLGEADVQHILRGMLLRLSSWLLPRCEPDTCPRVPPGFIISVIYENVSMRYAPTNHLEETLDLVDSTPDSLLSTILMFIASSGF